MKMILTVLQTLKPIFLEVKLACLENWQDIRKEYGALREEFKKTDKNVKKEAV